MCEEVFQNYSEYERIMKFSRPKVLRLLEILRLYRPPMPIKADSKEVPHPEDAEFKLQRTVKNSTEAESENVLKVPQKNQGTEAKDGNIEPVPDVPPPVAGVASSAGPVPSTPTHFSRRRRADFMNRNYRYRDDMHQLCGIIFVERRTTAKLLYHLLKVTPALAINSIATFL